LLDALLASRPSAANDRFDTEIEAAVAAGALDVATARALRYRQRASVEAVESYLRDTLGAILHVHRLASARAAADVAAEDEAWSWAIAHPATAAPHDDPVEAVEQPVRLTAVPDLALPDPAVPVRSRTADETKAAIRAALQS
jgi:hypothetical protein